MTTISSILATLAVVFVSAEATPGPTSERDLARSASRSSAQHEHDQSQGAQSLADFTSHGTVPQAHQTGRSQTL